MKGYGIHKLKMKVVRDKVEWVKPIENLSLIIREKIKPIDKIKMR